MIGYKMRHPEFWIIHPECEPDLSEMRRATDADVLSHPTVVALRAERDRFRQKHDALLRRLQHEEGGMGEPGKDGL